MADLIDHLYLAAIPLVMIGGVAAFIGALFFSFGRRSLIAGLPLAFVGFAIGASLGGGFGQTAGWGWGNLAALVLGLSFAGAGVLTGFGVYGFIAGSRATAYVGTLFGLAFPLIAILHGTLRPWLLDREFTHWKRVLDSQDLVAAEHFRGSTIASVTRQRIKAYAYGTPPEKSSEPFFDALWDQRTAKGDRR